MVTKKRKQKAGKRKRTSRHRPATPAGPAERIVPIPEITVFSQLPFGEIGKIGGKPLPLHLTLEYESITRKNVPASRKPQTLPKKRSVSRKAREKKAARKR